VGSSRDRRRPAAMVRSGMTARRRCWGSTHLARMTLVAGGTSASASGSSGPPASREVSTTGVHPCRGRYSTLRTFRDIETPPSGGKENSTMRTARAGRSPSTGGGLKAARRRDVGPGVVAGSGRWRSVTFEGTPIAVCRGRVGWILPTWRQKDTRRRGTRRRRRCAAATPHGTVRPTAVQVLAACGTGRGPRTWC
jgi:hypothetical protein